MRPRVPPELFPLLRGMVLGDGYLKPRQRDYKLVLHHGKDAREYIEYKREILLPLHPSQVFPAKDGSLHVSTQVSPDLTWLAHEMYLGNRKLIRLKTLDLLNPEAIALWVMDDGSFDPVAHTMRLSTNGFSGPENQLIRAWFFHRHGIWLSLGSQPGHPSRPGSTRRPYLLALHAEAMKLSSLIRSFVIPPMAYRIHPDRECAFGPAGFARRDEQPPPPRTLLRRLGCLICGLPLGEADLVSKHSACISCRYGSAIEFLQEKPSSNRRTPATQVRQPTELRRLYGRLRQRRKG